MHYLKQRESTSGGSFEEGAFGGASIIARFSDGDGLSGRILSVDRIDKKRIWLINRIESVVGKAAKKL